MRIDSLLYRLPVEESGLPNRVEMLASGDQQGLEAIGRHRVAVWRAEGVLAPELAATGIWLDAFDAEARHWVVRDDAGGIVACARLTEHDVLLASPDGGIWHEHRRPLPLPVGNFGKLVVAAAARGQGLASALNDARLAHARARGLKSLTVTASAANAKLLAKIGFEDTGWIVSFTNRPGVPFHALELRL